MADHKMQPNLSEKTGQADQYKTFHMTDPQVLTGRISRLPLAWHDQRTALGFA